MRNRLLGYGAIAVVSIGVGVFVGGGPGVLIDQGDPVRPSAAAERPASTTQADAPTGTTGTVVADAAAEEPVDDATTEPTTTVAPTTSRAPADEDGGEEDAGGDDGGDGDGFEVGDEPAPPTPGSTVGGPDDVATTVATVPLDLAIVVANGANLQGVATLRAGFIEDEGFTDVVPLNASELSEVTTVFHTPGFGAAAQDVATAAGFPDAPISPWDDRPELEVDVEYDVLLLLGTDLQPAP